MIFVDVVVILDHSLLKLLPFVSLSYDINQEKNPFLKRAGDIWLAHVLVLFQL